MAVHISLYVRRHTSRFVYFKLISRAYVLRLMPFIQFLEIFKTNTCFSAGRLRALWILVTEWISWITKCFPFQFITLSAVKKLIYFRGFNSSIHKLKVLVVFLTVLPTFNFYLHKFSIRPFPSVFQYIMDM